MDSCYKCADMVLEKQTHGYGCNKPKRNCLHNISKTLPYNNCKQKNASPPEKVCFEFESRPCFKNSSQDNSVCTSENICAIESSVDPATRKSCFKRKRSPVSNLPCDPIQHCDTQPNKSYCHKHRPGYSDLPELPDLSDVDCCLSASIAQVAS